MTCNYTYDHRNIGKFLNCSVEKNEFWAASGVRVVSLVLAQIKKFHIQL